MTDYELTQRVIGCAMKVHSALGPGLLESAYQECLCFELMKAGLFVEKHLGLIINFHVLHLRDGIRRVVNRYDDSASSAKTSASSAVKKPL